MLAWWQIDSFLGFFGYDSMQGSQLENIIFIFISLKGTEEKIIQM